MDLFYHLKSQNIFILSFLMINYNQIIDKLQMPPHKKYAKISLQKRQKLVHMVLEQKKSISQAARKYMIKPSTAKLILKRFQQTGQHFIKKMPNFTGNRQRSSEVQEIQKQETEQKLISNEVAQAQNEEKVNEVVGELMNSVSYEEWVVPVPGIVFYYIF